MFDSLQTDRMIKLFHQMTLFLLKRIILLVMSSYSKISNLLIRDIHPGFGLTSVWLLEHADEHEERFMGGG